MALALRSAGAVELDAELPSCRQPVTVTLSDELVRDGVLVCDVGGGVCAAAATMDAATNAAVAVASCNRLLIL